MGDSSVKKNRIVAGAKRALPIVLGYIPIGFAYGVLADKSGLSPFNTILMSIIVFAGSAQFVAVGLFAAGAGALSVILTTFVVNLRHMLMSAALSPFMAKWKKWQLSLFSFELTDESFALHSARSGELNDEKVEAVSLNVTAQISWIGGTILGIFASNLILDIKPLGIDYALAAMFIGLLVGQCGSFVRVITAIAAGLLATGLYLAGFDQFHVIAATVTAATFGLGVEQWIKK